MQLQNLLADFEELLSSDDQQSDLLHPSQHMLIYRNNRLAALCNALQNAYPMLLKLLGDDFFRTTSEDYIAQFPSRQADLNAYGEYFSHFLAHYSPAKQLVYLPEVAAFEWACHQVFFAADHAPLNVIALEKISADDYSNLRLVMHPASRLMRCQFPMLQLIDLCKNNLDDIVDIDVGGVDLLIIRRELDLKLVSLTAAEFAFLSAVQDEYCLSDAVSAALLQDPTFDLNTKLPQWVRDKTIVRIEL